MVHPVLYQAKQIWTWCLYLFIRSIFVATAVHAQAQFSGNRRNVTISSNSSEIVYTPFVCNASFTVESPQSCRGAWQVAEVDDLIFVSSQGPAPNSANIIPQMFFRFQASALYITTSPLSNSTSNITISTDSIATYAVFNSSVGAVTVLNLPETEVTTVTITHISNDAGPSRLDIGPLTLTVKNSSSPNTSSLILPPPTPPSPAPLPTITFPSSTLPDASQVLASNRKLIALGVGIVLGLGFGLTAIAAAGFIFWRRRRRRKQPTGGEGGSFMST